MPPRVEPPHPGQGGVKVGGAGVQRDESPVACWRLRGMRTCVHRRDLSESYSIVCRRTLVSTTAVSTLAVYQRESAGPVPCHHTAILCPDRRSAATLGVVVVLPCSILRSRLHFACEMRRVYGVFWGGRASERNTTAWGVVWTQGHTVTLTFAHRVLSTGSGATGP